MVDFRDWCCFVDAARPEAGFKGGAGEFPPVLFRPGGSRLNESRRGTDTGGVSVLYPMGSPLGSVSRLAPSAPADPESSAVESRPGTRAEEKSESHCRVQLLVCLGFRFRL